MLINKCLEPSSNYLSPLDVRSLSHGVPHIECGYPHVATVAVAWGGVVYHDALRPGHLTN